MEAVLCMLHVLLHVQAEAAAEEHASHSYVELTDARAAATPLALVDGMHASACMLPSTCLPATLL